MESHGMLLVAVSWSSIEEVGLGKIDQEAIWWLVRSNLIRISSGGQLGIFDEDVILWPVWKNLIRMSSGGQLGQIWQDAI